MEKIIEHIRRVQFFIVFICLGIIASLMIKPNTHLVEALKEARFLSNLHLSLDTDSILKAREAFSKDAMDKSPFFKELQQGLFVLEWCEDNVEDLYFDQGNLDIWVSSENAYNVNEKFNYWNLYKNKECPFISSSDPSTKKICFMGSIQLLGIIDDHSNATENSLILPVSYQSLDYYSDEMIAFFLKDEESSRNLAIEEVISRWNRYRNGAYILVPMYNANNGMVGSKNNSINFKVSDEYKAKLSDRLEKNSFDVRFVKKPDQWEQCDSEENFSIGNYCSELSFQGVLKIYFSYDGKEFNVNSDNVARPYLWHKAWHNALFGRWPLFEQGFTGGNTTIFSLGRISIDFSIETAKKFIDIQRSIVKDSKQKIPNTFIYGRFETSFPHFYKETKEIDSILLNQAAKEIERRYEDEKRRESNLIVQGLRFSTSLIEELGLITLSIMLLYFSLHLNFLKLSIKEGNHIPQVPWVGLYRDKLPKFVFFIFSLFLPATVGLTLTGIRFSKKIFYSWTFNGWLLLFIIVLGWTTYVFFSFLNEIKKQA